MRDKAGRILRDKAGRPILGGGVVSDIRKDARGNAAAFGVATVAEQGGRAGGRYLAGKAASTKPGYQAAMTLKRLLSKY
jgi:hypothetical protein